MNTQHTPERMTNAQLHGCAFEGWQCFHCGEVFTTVGAARDHFGASPTAKPGCIAKVGLGNERGLQMALREAEQQRDDLQTELLSLVRAIKCSSARGYISADRLKRAEAIAKVGAV